MKQAKKNKDNNGRKAKKNKGNNGKKVGQTMCFSRLLYISIRYRIPLANAPAIED